LILISHKKVWKGGYFIPGSVTPQASIRAYNAS